MEPMHVLMVTPTFPPALGGGARYAGALTSQLVDHGHRVTVVTTNARYDADLWDGREEGEVMTGHHGRLRVTRLPVAGALAGRVGLMAWRKGMVVLSQLPGDPSALLMRMAARVPRIPGLQSALEEAAPCDLVHGLNISWESPLVAGWRLARRRGIPFVVTPFVHLGSGAHDRTRLNNTMAHQRRVLADADAVLAMTDVEAERLRGIGVPADRLHVIGAAVERPPPSLSEGGLSDLLRRHELARPFVLFLGRVSRDKGAIHAAEAVRALHRRGMPVALALVGEAAPEFLRYYRKLPSEERGWVRVLGVLDDRSKHGLLSACRLLALPSRADSFGIVFLEAWAHGKPVIGARAGGIPGVVTEGEDGLLVAYGDVAGLARAMSALLDDPALARRLGRAGRAKLSQRYTWEIVYGRLEQVYRAVLDRV